MARLTVNGADLAVFTEGTGDPPFVFVHGLACDHTVWQPQFENLSKDHRCVAIDLRGCGDSAPAPPFDATQAADDIAEVIRELGLGPSIIVGHSSGGAIALLVNDRHPETVLGIVLGDATLTSASGGGWAELMQRIDAAGSVEPLSPLVDSFFVEDTPDEVREKVRSLMLSARPEVAAGMLANGSVFVERMGELLKKADEKPFMAIWSDQPRGNPERLRDTLLFIRQEPMADAGHFFQLERPDVTNALLRAFLDDVERDPRIK